MLQAISKACTDQALTGQSEASGPSGPDQLQEAIRSGTEQVLWDQIRWASGYSNQKPNIELYKI